MTALGRKILSLFLFLIFTVVSVVYLFSAVITMKSNPHSFHTLTLPSHSFPFKESIGEYSRQKSNGNVFKTSSNSQQCTHETCFNFTLCPVFVYPNTVWNTTKTGNMIYGKTYLTDNPKYACIFVFFWTSGSDLKTLKYWGDKGKNHIVINLDINEEGPTNPSHAIVAQPLFKAFPYRHRFDYILPFYKENATDIWNILPPRFPLRRKYRTSYFEGDISRGNINSKYVSYHNDLTRYLKTHKSENYSLNIFSKCYPRDILSCSQAKRHQLFAESTFTILLMPLPSNSDRYWKVFQIVLLEILQSGSIPVLIGDTYYLPLQEYIDWKKILVIFHWNSNLQQLLPFLSSLAETDILQFKIQGKRILERILSLKSSILAAILESIHDRSGVPRRKFTPYKSQILYHYQPKGIKEKEYIQQGSFRDGGHSAKDLTLPAEVISFFDPNRFLLLTYQREDVLYQILSEFRGLHRHVDRIVVVWNEVGREVNTSLIPHSDIPVYVVSSGKNSLNNRFLPFDVIRTDSIFSIDDDLTLAKESILLAFRVWRENRDRLVGFPGRYHIWDSEKEKYLYKGSTSTSGFSMVLTGACFFHKHYSYLYTYVMQRAIWEYVEENLNCEDIAMNFLVADITRRPPIKVSKTLFYPCKYCGKKSISTSKSHNRKRIESLNFFSKVYGYMPLIYTQFSTDYLYNAKLYNKYFKNDI